MLLLFAKLVLEFASIWTSIAAAESLREFSSLRGSEELVEAAAASSTSESVSSADQNSWTASNRFSSSAWWSDFYLPRDKNKQIWLNEGIS